MNNNYSGESYSGIRTGIFDGFVRSTSKENNVRSPEWLLKIDDLLESNIDEFKDHCELLKFESQASRETSGNAGGQLFKIANMQHSDVVLTIPNGSYVAKLENKMNQGQPLQLVSIVHLGNINNTKVKMQVIDHENCWIQKMQPLHDSDSVMFSIKIRSKVNTIYVYDHDGVNKGQMVSSANYAANTTKH